MKKLAIITTHPIQYNAPLFALLHSRGKIAVKIFYTWSQAIEGEKYDPGFGKAVAWDIPLLEGYQWEAVENTATLPGSDRYNGIINPGLTRTIEDYKPDALLVYGWNFKSHLAQMRYFKGKIPVLFRGDSTLLNADGMLKKAVRKLFLNRIYRNIDFALYAGMANKAYFKFAGVKENQLHFMPHVVDNKRFNLTSKDCIDKVKAIRSTYNVPERDLLLLFSGKLSESKNIFRLCEFMTLHEDLPVSLLIVGSGPLEQLLKQKFESKSIKFAGFQNQAQMPIFYNAADVVILPSKKINETWGLCLNEGMAAGKAVIASDGCGATPDLVQHNVNGFVLPLNDFDKLRTYLQILVDKPEQRAAMGRASFNKIKNYTLEEASICVENIMMNIL